MSCYTETVLTYNSQWSDVWTITMVQSTKTNNPYQYR